MFTHLFLTEEEAYYIARLLFNFVINIFRKLLHISSERSLLFLLLDITPFCIQSIAYSTNLQ